MKGGIAMQRKRRIALLLTLFVVGFFLSLSSVSANPRRPAIASNSGRNATNVVVLVEEKDLEIETFHKVDESKNHYTMSDENNYIVVKHGNGHVLVWTYDLLTDVERENFKSEFLRLNGNRAGINMFTEFHFFNGFQTIDGSIIARNWGTYEVINNGDGTYSMYTTADKVSHIYFGRYLIDREEEPVVEYEWVLVSSKGESATGLNSINDELAGPSWFRKQVLDFTNTNTVVIPINAGNPSKNDILIVGYTTITRNGYDHTINYSFRNDPKDLNANEGDIAIIVIDNDDSRFNYADNIKHAPGQNLKLSNGTVFTYEPLVFDYYNHFSVTVETWEFQEVSN